MTKTWLTWANLLTAIRLAALPPIIWCIGQQRWWAAAALFIVAVVTDVFDGKLARRLHQTSPAGGLFDHGTDALFVTCGCWAIAQLDLINPILPWLIPLAFIQYMLDSKALQGIPLRMSTLGRYNGVAYYVVLGSAIGGQALTWHWLSLPVTILAWLLVLTTLLSMLDRALTLWRSQNS